MMIRNIKIKFMFMFAIIMMAFFCVKVFAAKYTITNGIDFNTRIKLAINENYTSATEEKTIKAFKSSYSLPNDDTKVIDISEDGDSSVLAYIKDNIIYYVSEDEVYLNKDSSYMFDKFLNIKDINLSELNYSKVRKTNYMFGNCKFLTKIDMENDTIIKLDEMKGMFFDCESLVDLYIYMLNTKNVTNMDDLFYNCKNIKNIIISQDEWSVSKVNSFKNMFKNCYLLKTNFGKKATDIAENYYINFAKYGTDEGREGLLKEVDYEYDDYGENDGEYKVDSIDATLIKSSGSENVNSNVDTEIVKKAKEKSNIVVASDSVFYEQMADVSIKNGKMKFSDRLLKETVKDIPILLEETTYVDVIKYKNKSTSSDIDDIAPVSTESDTFVPGGVLRHDYGKDKIATNSTYESTTESAVESKDSSMSPLSIESNALDVHDESDDAFSKIEEESSYDKSFRFSIDTLIVLVSILLVILISVIFTLSKHKKENDELKDGSI